VIFVKYIINLNKVAKDSLVLISHLGLLL